MHILTRNILSALIVTSLFVAPIAEAKRVGGGKSYGMSRSSNTNSGYSNQSSQRPNTYNNNPSYHQPQPQQQGMSNTGKMVAAGVAGAAIGAIAANAMADNHHTAAPVQQANPSQQATQWQNNGQAQAAHPVQGGSSFAWILLIILAIGGFVLFRKMQARQRINEAMAGQNINNSSANNAFGQPPIQGFNNSPNQGFSNTDMNSGATFNSGHALPDGTEPAAFLRFARQRFNHIQSMNGASNVQEIQKYFTADLYQAIYQDIINNDMVAEFNNINAMIANQSIENGQYVVSVRFTGTVSENLNSQPENFSEVWHFVKPMGANDWLVAGIQQD